MGPGQAQYIHTHDCHSGIFKIYTLVYINQYVHFALLPLVIINSWQRSKDVYTKDGVLPPSQDWTDIIQAMNIITEGLKETF